MARCSGSPRCCCSSLTSHFWLAALGRYLVRAEPPAHADMIVVLAGDFSGNRILTRRRFGPPRLRSQSAGERTIGAYGLHETDLAIPFAVRHGYPESYFIAAAQRFPVHRDEADDVLAALQQAARAPRRHRHQRLSHPPRRQHLSRQSSRPRNPHGGRARPLLHARRLVEEPRRAQDFSAGMDEDGGNLARDVTRMSKHEDQRDR